jgi:hypothetical protein
MRLRNIVFAVFLCLWAQAVRAEDNVLKGYQFGGWNADFGIEERLRYEYKTNFDFNNNLDDDGSLFLTGCASTAGSPAMTHTKFS